MSANAESVTGTVEPLAKTPLRFVTAASLFDGHDAAINIMRRLIQSKGAEVIHLGHNRSVADVVRAAIQEDADGIAISSYQGGHNEYFRYMVDMLREFGAEHIQVFGGGGGTITPEEIRALMDYGVARIYHPNDGMQLGLDAMIDDLIEQTLNARVARRRQLPSGTATVSEPAVIAETISALEAGAYDDETLARLRREWSLAASVPVIGITGTGGAGKSSVTDEILNRFTHFFPGRRIAVVAVDPTRRRTGGALLGDRIR
ncbi:MAG: cobalamin-dependent protein, partial [Pseudomonadota bacterium]